MTNIKNFIYSFFLGAISVYSFAPFYFVFIWLVTIPLFKWTIEHSKKPVLHGWAFGSGLFTASIYWFTYALLVDPDKFAWLIPFAVFGIGAFLGLYFAIFAFLYRKVRRSPLIDILSFASIWTILEIIRTYALTGFPWNLTGYSLTGFISQIQLGSIIGIYGISFFIVLFSASLTLLLQKKYRFLPIIFITLAVGLNYAYGTYRLQENPTQYLEARVRLVQPNISQHEKWHPLLAEQHLSKLIDLSLTSDSPSIWIWPEAAFNYTIFENARILKLLGEILPQNHILITGTNRYNGDSKNPLFWNSLHVIDSYSKILGFYDKSHLVPFGEYVPFEKYLPIEKIVPGFGSFAEGEGLENINIPKYLPKFSPLICYEVIFPQKVALSDTELMINVTNDGWYLDSSGPYQHYEMARFRSIEEGLPLIRVANTGISAVIDPYGREIEKTRLLEERVVDSNIPKAIEVRTFYSRNGNVLLYVLFIMNISLLWINKRK
jgi:apolipoprotein N-acyltransferase